MGGDPKTDIQYGMNYLNLDDEGQAVVKASQSALGAYEAIGHNRQ
jgi:hypothetical protein